jgi:hypothetical protein
MKIHKELIKVHAVQYHEVYKRIIAFQKSWFWQRTLPDSKILTSSQNQSLSVGFPENLERIKYHSYP